MDRRGRPRATPEHLEPVLHAVIRLSVTRGAAAVSFRDIADEAGVSVGMLQHHFGTRAALLERAHEWYLLGVTEHMRGIAREDLPPWEKLLKLCVRVSSREDRAQRASIWVELLAQSARDASMRALVGRINREWSSVLEEVIDAGVHSGDFRPSGTARVAAQLLVTFVDGLDVAELTGVAGEPPGSWDGMLFEVARMILGAGPAAA
ncbi:TetR/AcrR family transcriptional regulator [Specibacter cremeus]|uniref:TetR/AcrR family transcriptional regulator n=1 Tax=Specibacter cremeus TaxID=1629051 RepID=UPI000F79D4EC|nr:TetR family transcriptional regulator C-terminal domain-containing protein [Specibacter cremeus]